MTKLQDGTGNNGYAEVNKFNQLEVRSESNSFQHVISHRDGQAYQVIGSSTLASATIIPLHIKNTSTDKNMVITYIRHQVIDQAGGTALPSLVNYLRIAFDRTVASGGSAAIPVNMNTGSGNTAEVTATEANPTMAGTAAEFDRWYTKAEGDMDTWNKEGAVLVAPNGTVELAYVGDQTSGTVFTRVSFLMEDVDVI